MIAAIRDGARRRGISRLCHFTPSRNLVHIATDLQGLLATERLSSTELAAFNPTDLQRLDGYRDHVCCSIQYPNAWYFQKARSKDLLFRDWVVLMLKPDSLWMPGTRFCPRNAASGGGRFVHEGAEAFETLFAQSVTGAYDKVYTRGPGRLESVPTDDQAEVLIPDSVSSEDVLGFAVLDGSQARREMARLKQLNAPVPRIWVAPDFFNANWLSSILRSGGTPREEEFYAGDSNG